VFLLAPQGTDKMSGRRIVNLIRGDLKSLRIIRYGSTELNPGERATRRQI
jgi:hypothetical protein